MSSHMRNMSRLTSSFSKNVLVKKHAPAAEFTQVRWKVYPKSYMDPTINREELAKPLPELDERRFRPIKAAKVDETTSVFYDPDVNKFVSTMMKGGNKQLVTDIMEKTFENIKKIQVEKYHKASPEEREAIECNPAVIFHQAVENCKPVLILTKIPKGGVMYRVPIPCVPNQQKFRAMKWIIESCRDKERKLPMEVKLSLELLDAYNNQGKSIRKKQDLHRQCEANKAYAHFRW
ncbi:small ribosomal subunit protein uS7m-like [Liolophura sinensis]|uniref:small ribosomal subunit protein uS7m-like n=1 Tax=Liolophura sinensis TaxID=3198878 RepID=UPI00315818A8